MDGTPQIASDGAEERILALLTLAYGKTVRPGVLGNIRRAAKYWRRGETHLAAIEIALSGLPALPDQEQACMRLHRGEEALAQGLTPRELIKACGLNPAALDVLKSGYNPGQPRVPAGNPDGGQWTSSKEQRRHRPMFFRSPPPEDSSLTLMIFKQPRRSTTY